MTARVRAAGPADVDAILALERLFPSDAMARRAVQRFMRVPTARFWVAVERGAVVGNLLLLLRVGSDYGRVYSVVVAPAARGQGLGNRLIACAEQAVRAAGRSRLRLEVRTDNHAAQALYARRGYREVTRLPRYYADGADGLRLEKSLR